MAPDGTPDSPEQRLHNWMRKLHVILQMKCKFNRTTSIYCLIFAFGVWLGVFPSYSFPPYSKEKAHPYHLKLSFVFLPIPYLEPLNADGRKVNQFPSDVFICLNSAQIYIRWLSFLG